MFFSYTFVFYCTQLRFVQLSNKAYIDWLIDYLTTHAECGWNYWSVYDHTCIANCWLILVHFRLCCSIELLYWHFYCLRKYHKKIVGRQSRPVKLPSLSLCCHSHHWRNINRQTATDVAMSTKGENVDFISYFLHSRKL